MGQRRWDHRGFSIFELVLVFTFISILAAAGASRLNHSTYKLSKDYEARRLLSILRCMRDMANNGGVDAPTGYGVFFWNNPNTNTCFEYSPYVPRNPTVPNAHGNLFKSYAMMGQPDTPLVLGLRTPEERASLTATQVASGTRSDFMDIYFQSDQQLVPNLIPAARRQYLSPGVPMTPIPADAWKDNAILFFPAGQQPNVVGVPWAPSWWFAPCTGAQHGVLLPRSGCSGVTYNRIYIRSDKDTIMNPLTFSAYYSIPTRIWIHPATGVMRLMEPYERRADGTW